LGSQGTVIAGGRYDGLVEALGGPPTPAVGWAAGIERLAMMIDAPAVEAVDVAIVVENERAAMSAFGVAAHLRGKGLSAEIYATGSPRKRRDRAVKRGAGNILTLDVGEGRIKTRLSGIAQEEVEASLAGYAWPEPTAA
jgi:histidyl-tRNA synthetase